ncbi:hypothetical protein EZS27_025461 [termite gut metagenome]|uniref:Uncharacterized protein n=1 Tax=termite gut metagenome TaxID=433724 RepID=A0A5J4QUS2_9ZZZZ
MKLHLAEHVFEDLKTIYCYIATDTPERANKTVRYLYGQVIAIEHTPYIGRIVPEYNIKMVRALIRKNYHIVYKINEEDDMIHGLAIVHSSRLLSNALRVE